MTLPEPGQPRTNDEQQGKICVVMPAYKAERTLEQTYRDLPLEWVDDIVVVDDASRDRTVELAKKLGRFMSSFIPRIAVTAILDWLRTECGLRIAGDMELLRYTLHVKKAWKWPLLDWVGGLLLSFIARCRRS